jgi:hypothetical protein
VLLALVSGVGCRAQAAGGGAPVPVPIETVARGSISRIVTAEQVVIDSAGDWQAFWARHAPGTTPPPVDFTTEFVVAILAGRRPSAGYRVEVLAIEREPAVITVVYRVGTPPPDALVAQVVTAPFQIVRLPRPVTPVRFEPR